MGKLSKIPLYAKTVRHLKPSQVAYRIWRRVGGKTPLRRGYEPDPNPERACIGNIALLPELDFDPAFLGRFDVVAILDDRICLLHHEEAVDWKLSWHEKIATPLWRFNLHYFEFLLPLAKAYLDTGELRYLEKGKWIIYSWITSCPRSSGGAAWDSYTISMRVVNWLAFYGELAEPIDGDTVFVRLFNESLVMQYRHLAMHLERDLLANHYLENLKALAILASYFEDIDTLSLVLPLLESEIANQILADGMHYELSPMYHKVVLEDLLRVAVTLDGTGVLSSVLEVFRLQEMADCLYSLEVNVDRTPLFNDSGDNVAKSREALLECLEVRFGIRPERKALLPDAGYAFLDRDTKFGHVKLIFDVGRLGPEEALGHAHCDALSFEVFLDGKPWVVNLGTYAYQDESRLARKLTGCHNAPMLDGAEQAECWAPFRVGAHGSASLDLLEECRAIGHYTYSDGRVVERTILLLGDSLKVVDVAIDGGEISSVIHMTENFPPSVGSDKENMYSPEFGLKYGGYRKTYRGMGRLEFELPYPTIELQSDTIPLAI